MIVWHSSKSEFDGHIAKLEQAREVVESYITFNPTTLYCDNCGDSYNFSIETPDNTAWVNIREMLRCSNCGLSARQLLMFASALQVASDHNFRRVVIMERLSDLFRFLKRKMPVLDGTEYLGPEPASGIVAVIGGVPVEHQNMMALSYDDSSLDMILHSDVLEHVADFRKGLRECARVLRPGGVLLFTCPFFPVRESHTIRAELIGEIVHHHLEPAYHSNYLGGALGMRGDTRALVFADFGWPLITDLREAGFSKVAVGLWYDIGRGFLSDNNPSPEWRCWPVVFRCER